MGNGKYIIELTDLIPVRSINFYLDACQAMGVLAVLNFGEFDESGIELEKLKALMFGGEKAPASREMIRDRLPGIDTRGDIGGMKLLGHVILNTIGQKEQGGTLATLPFVFLCYAVLEDLVFHGHEPDFFLVEKFMAELPMMRKNICSYFSGNHIKTIWTRYTPEDIAAIFAGYSLISNGAPLPLVPFPHNPAGFAALLHFEMKKFSPRNTADHDF